MSKFLSEVKGFTPVIDVLAQEMGLMTAVVYGIVWRYCQMENKVCTASRERIAEHAGISSKTVERHLKELCKHGYLEDLTPDWKGKAHEYADTGRAKIQGLLTVEIENLDRKSCLDKQGKTESLAPKTESLITSDTESHQPKTESLTRREEDTSHDRLGDSAFQEKAEEILLVPSAVVSGEGGGDNVQTQKGSTLPDMRMINNETGGREGGKGKPKGGDDDCGPVNTATEHRKTGGRVGGKGWRKPWSRAPIPPTQPGGRYLQEKFSWWKGFKDEGQRREFESLERRMTLARFLELIDEIHGEGGYHRDLAETVIERAKAETVTKGVEDDTHIVDEGDYSSAALAVLREAGLI